MRDKLIRLIKKLIAELKNLLGSPCIKRRIGRRAIKDCQMGEQQNPPYPFNVAPTSRDSGTNPEVDDYG